MKHYFQPTPQQIDMVQNWLMDGMTMTQIGTLLGVTRNVVSGIIWRRPPLKAIQKSKYGGSSMRHWTTPPKEKIVTKFLEETVPDMPEPPPVDENVEPAATPPAPKGVILTDLGINMCKFPLAWDNEATGHWRFCGQPTLPDRPYCPKHFCRTNTGQLGPYKGPTR